MYHRLSTTVIFWYASVWIKNYKSRQIKCELVWIKIVKGNLTREHLQCLEDEWIDFWLLLWWGFKWQIVFRCPTSHNILMKFIDHFRTFLNYILDIVYLLLGFPTSLTILVNKIWDTYRVDFLSFLISSFSMLYLS